MVQYTKGFNSEQTRDIKVSVRINSTIKKWLDRQTEKENISISSYIYEIINFCQSEYDPDNIYDLRVELPHIQQIKQSFNKYMNLYNVKGSLFEERICIYLDPEKMAEIKVGCSIYHQEMSEIIRLFVHFFFIADNYFKTNFDIADDLHDGLVLNTIRMRYFIYDLISPEFC